MLVKKLLSVYPVSFVSGAAGFTRGISVDGDGHSACATNTVSMVTPAVYSSNITVCSAILLAVVSDVSS